MKNIFYLAMTGLLISSCSDNEVANIKRRLVDTDEAMEEELKRIREKHEGEDTPKGDYDPDFKKYSGKFAWAYIQEFTDAYPPIKKGGIELEHGLVHQKEMNFVWHTETDRGKGKGEKRDVSISHIISLKLLKISDIQVENGLLIIPLKVNRDMQYHGIINGKKFNDRRFSWRIELTENGKPIPAYKVDELRKAFEDFADDF